MAAHAFLADLPKSELVLECALASGNTGRRKGGPLAGIPRKIVASGGTKILLLGVDRVILTR